MEIRFTEEKVFTREQVQQLFLSVNWMSGQYPDKLYQALMHSSTVLTPREGHCRKNDRDGKRKVQRISLYRRNAGRE